jgi:hypothetical protein
VLVQNLALFILVEHGAMLNVALPHRNRDRPCVPHRPFDQWSRRTRWEDGTHAEEAAPDR